MISTAAAVAKLPVRSCLIDGEAIACDESGLAVFDMIRYRRHDHAVTLCAFDLLELDGEDLRRMPIETRKLTLKSLLRGKHAGIVFNQHFVADGASVYRQACALGCEGIVSKRLGSLYRPGRVVCWIKVKNPAAPAAEAPLPLDLPPNRSGGRTAHLEILEHHDAPRRDLC